MMLVLSHFKSNFFSSAFWTLLRHNAGGMGDRGPRKRAPQGGTRPREGSKNGTPSWSRSGFGRALRTGSQAAPAAPPAPRVHSSYEEIHYQMLICVKFRGFLSSLTVRCFIWENDRLLLSRLHRAASVDRICWSKRLHISSSRRDVALYVRHTDSDMVLQ